MVDRTRARVSPQAVCSCGGRACAQRWHFNSRMVLDAAFTAPVPKWWHSIPHLRRFHHQGSQARVERARAQQAVRSCELLQQAVRSCELMQRCRRCQRAQTIRSCEFLGQTPQRRSPSRHADVIVRVNALLNPVHARATRLATAMCPGRASTPSASSDQQAVTRVPLVKGTQKNRPLVKGTQKNGHGGSTSGMPPHEARQHRPNQKHGSPQQR